MNATLSHDDNNDDDVSDGDNKIDDDGVDGECDGFDVDSPFDNLFQFCANLFHLAGEEEVNNQLVKNCFNLVNNNINIPRCVHVESMIRLFMSKNDLEGTNKFPKKTSLFSVPIFSRSVAC